ncbi:MAG: hypothetical protein HYX69_06315 [Planctomycetia bacterium]|nr:hypothetical protein [Planctomycetia bacterium]
MNNRQKSLLLAHWRGVVIVLTVPFALLLSANVKAGAEQSKTAFLEQYEPAARRLEAFYNSLTMSGTLTRSNFNKKQFPSREKIVLRGNGASLRFDIDEPTDNGTVAGDGELSIVFTPKDTFEVTRDAATSAYVLRQMSATTDRLSMVQRQRYYLFATYFGRTAIPRPILENLRRPALQITSIEEDPSGGEMLVKVSYTETVTFNRKPLTYSGWFLFSKTDGWALRGSFEKGDRPDAKAMRADIKYNGKVDGIPLLQSAEYWMEKDGTRFDVERFDVVSIQPGAAPAQDFSLAAFGIRDAREERESRHWLFLVAAGIALVAIAIVLARLRLRESRR